MEMGLTAQNPACNKTEVDGASYTNGREARELVIAEQ